MSELCILTLRHLIYAAGRRVIIFRMNTIKLMQWNVWYHEKYQNIVDFIKRSGADIVCCQELTTNFIDANPGIDVASEIAKACNYNYYYQPVTAYNDRGQEIKQGNGIFSKFPIVEKSFKYVQKADPNIKSFDTEDRAYVEIIVDIEGKLLKVGTVHLSYSTAFAMTEKKLAEAEKLYEIVKGNHEKFIFAADLNAKPDSPIIKKLEELFIHADPNTDRPTWTTKPFSYEGFEANSRDWRLDYIFATEDINVITNKILDTSYSDHLPILTEIQI
jgi:endonuclease/exonuclease/phosphatase family metal-dependent hydrolase